MKTVATKDRAAARVAAVTQVIADHNASIAALEMRIGSLRAKVGDLTLEFEGLVDARNERNLEATLASRPLPDDDPDESARLRQIKTEIGAVEAALPVIAEERATLERATPTLRKELAEAFLSWKADKVRQVLRQASAVLATLQQPVARLSALDAVQSEVLGETFDVGPSINEAEMRDALLSTGALAGRLLEGLPKRLKPEELTLEKLAPAADAARTSLLAEIDR